MAAEISASSFVGREVEEEKVRDVLGRRRGWILRRRTAVRSNRTDSQ